MLRRVPGTASVRASGHRRGAAAEPPRRQNLFVSMIGIGSPLGYLISLETATYAKFDDSIFSSVDLCKSECRSFLATGTSDAGSDAGSRASCHVDLPELREDDAS
jgi:hypothetical protein